MTKENYLDPLKWTEDGLIPAIAQDAVSGKVLMMAWMNRESLAQTVASREAVYWSRSRQKLWHKGESSGHVQHIQFILLDCDNDVVLLKVNQVGGIACHTGRESCFFQGLVGSEWVALEKEAVIKDPKEIYSHE